MAGGDARRGAGWGNRALGRPCSQGLSRANEEEEESSGDGADPLGQGCESLPFPEVRLLVLETPLKKTKQSKTKSKAQLSGLVRTSLREWFESCPPQAAASSEVANPSAVLHCYNPYHYPCLIIIYQENPYRFCAEPLLLSCAARDALFTVLCCELMSLSSVCPCVVDSERIKSDSVASKHQLEFKSQSELATTWFWSQGFKLLLPTQTRSVQSISALSTSGLEKKKIKGAQAASALSFIMQIPSPPRRAALNFSHTKGALYPPALIPNGFKMQCQDGHNLPVTTAMAITHHRGPWGDLLQKQRGGPCLLCR